MHDRNGIGRFAPDAEQYLRVRDTVSAGRTERYPFAWRIPCLVRNLEREAQHEVTVRLAKLRGYAGDETIQPGHTRKYILREFAALFRDLTIFVWRFGGAGNWRP